MSGEVLCFHRGQKKKTAIGKGVEDTKHIIFYKISKSDNCEGILPERVFSEPVLLVKGWVLEVLGPPDFQGQPEHNSIFIVKLPQ